MACASARAETLPVIGYGCSTINFMVQTFPFGRPTLGQRRGAADPIPATRGPKQELLKRGIYAHLKIPLR